MSTSSTKNSETAVTRGLWWVYGHTYDGLRYFWPYQNLLQLVQSKLMLEKGMSVLELGCGTGNVLERVLETPGVYATGVDLSPTMLKVAGRKLHRYQQNGQLDLHNDELLHYLEQVPDSSIDVIVSVNVLYAIREQAKLWKHLLRIIKPTGRIVITTSVKTGSLPIIKEHFSNASVISLFRPKLLGVFVVDSLINALGNSGRFSFHDEKALRKFVEDAGGTWTDTAICYGGAKEGVNILFTVVK